MPGQGTASQDSVTSGTRPQGRAGGSPRAQTSVGICSLVPRPPCPHWEQPRDHSPHLCTHPPLVYQYKRDCPASHQSRFITNTEGDRAPGRLGDKQRGAGLAVTVVSEVPSVPQYGCHGL